MQTWLNVWPLPNFAQRFPLCTQQHATRCANRRNMYVLIRNMKQYFVEQYTWNGKLILTTRRWRSKQKNKTKKYIGVLNIWKSYKWTAEWRIKWRHGSSHFCSCEKKAWKKFGLVRDSNPWPLRYRCSALSQLGAGRCDLSTDMKFYLFMIKKELRCTSKAQFSVITLHQSTVLTIYCAFILL